MRFARVFEFKTGQLLISITTDSDVEGYVLSLETYYQGLFIRTGLPFPTFGDASESKDELTEQRAEGLFNSLIQAAGNPSTITGRTAVVIARLLRNGVSRKINKNLKPLVHPWLCMNLFTK